jgi:hypothetical protein
MLRIRVTIAGTDSTLGNATTVAFAQGRLCNDMEAAAERFDTSWNSWGIVAFAAGLIAVFVGLILSTVLGDEESAWRPGYVIAIGGGIAVLAGVLIGVFG